jgi:peptide methionine sulfoxide reductase msrA/msrB
MKKWSLSPLTLIALLVLASCSPAADPVEDMSDEVETMVDEVVSESSTDTMKESEIKEYAQPQFSTSVDNIDPRDYPKPDEASIRDMLTDLQYDVTQNEATERSFNNIYHDHKEPGIYVDIVTGEPLFSSRDKYDSYTGWPSFTRPISDDVILEFEDKKLVYVRIEIKSRSGESHLGHVFDDGPAWGGGLRYCINSASLRFVHLDDMEEQGYGYLVSEVSVDN